MPRLIVPSAAAALALAGCSAPTPAPAPSPSPTATALAGEAARVAALSPARRAGVLLRAIRDAEQDCQQVIDQAETAAPGQPPVWVATCQDHRRWVVAITPDGTATVINANDLPKPR